MIVFVLLMLLARNMIKKKKKNQIRCQIVNVSMGVSVAAEYMTPTWFAGAELEMRDSQVQMQLLRWGGRIRGNTARSPIF